MELELDRRVGRLVRLHLDDGSRVDGLTCGHSEIFDTTDGDFEYHHRRMQRKYYCCLGGPFESADEAMQTFCYMEARGERVPCLPFPIDLVELEKTGAVFYVDGEEHPEIVSPRWREQHHRFGFNTMGARARRKEDDVETRRLRVVGAAVKTIRRSPFHGELPNAPSRRALDAACLEAMAPLDGVDATTEDVELTSTKVVDMRDMVYFSREYDADVQLFLLECAFVAHSGRKLKHKKPPNDGEGESLVKEAFALSRFDRGIRDVLKECLLR